MAQLSKLARRAAFAGVALPSVSLTGPLGYAAAVALIIIVLVFLLLAVALAVVALVANSARGDRAASMFLALVPWAHRRSSPLGDSQGTDENPGESH